MPRRPVEDRWAVISWYKEGLTTAEICRKTGFYKQFVTHWISKYKDSGSVEDAPRAGRPRKLSERVERAVVHDSAESSAPSRFARVQTA